MPSVQTLLSGKSVEVVNGLSRVPNRIEELKYDSILVPDRTFVDMNYPYMVDKPLE